MSVTLLVDIFYQSVACLFILLMVSFAVQRLVSLIGSHLFNFALFLLSWETDLKKKLVQFLSEDGLPMFSSRSFMVSCLIVKALSHFEFIFVYDVRVCTNFIGLHAAVQLCQHHLLKRLYFFFHCIFLASLSKINWL